MQDHDEPVFRTELIDRGKHESSDLGLLGDVRRRAVLVGERFISGFIERREDHVLARPPVVRKVDSDSVKPRAQRVVRLEPGERAVGPSEGIDHDLLGG